MSKKTIAVDLQKLEDELDLYEVYQVETDKTGKVKFHQQVGTFLDFEEAKTLIKENVTDLHETCFNYIYVYKLKFGLHYHDYSKLYYYHYKQSAHQYALVKVDTRDHD